MFCNTLLSCTLSLLLHHAFWRHLIYYISTNALLYYNSLKFFYIKTFKTLLHVSILRSSSGSIYCSLLKLHVKRLNTLLYVLVMRQHIVCMCICCVLCREVGRPTSLQRTQQIHIHTICCRITETYNKVFKPFNI